MQSLQYSSDIIHGQFHLFVIAPVGLSNQLIHFATGDLGKNAIAFTDRQQDGVEHFIDAQHHFAMNSGELVGPSSF